MKAAVMVVAVVTAGTSMCRPVAMRDLVVQPNSAQGFVSVVNLQKLVPEKEFADSLSGFLKWKNYTIDFSGRKNAPITISIIDEPGKPPMTVSPEAGVGCLNVAALTNDLTSAASVEKFLVARARKEFLRVFAFTFGVGSSQFKGNIFAAYSIRELDYIKEGLPADVVDKIDKSAKSRGMKPRRLVDYGTACQEGWAPAPTNDAQKTIWDKMHSIPSKPIKIEFDPKSDTK